MKQRKIVIVTTGQPSTNPRMVKEVDTLIDSGFLVRVFYSHWAGWGLGADKAILTKYPNVFIEVGGNPFTHRLDYFWSRLLHKIIRLLCPIFPFLSRYAMARTTWALSKVAGKEKAHLYIAHNLGALPAAATAARKNKALLGFDAEDYHRGEHAPSDPYYRICCSIEETYIPRCNYVTAASPLIAEAYRKLFPGKQIDVINNVFSKKFLQPIPGRKESTLNLFWFSQTVGPNRGLETVVAALNRMNGFRVSLTLLGDCSPAYRQQIASIATNPEIIHFKQPVPADKIFAMSSDFDIGLSTEVPYCANRDFCLTNKLFTYLLAGNCIVVSDTSAQQQFMDKYPQIGRVYRHNDPDHLATQLKVLLEDMDRLQQNRQAALSLAASVCNWEEESKLFLSIINNVLMLKEPKLASSAIA